MEILGKEYYESNYPWVTYFHNWGKRRGQKLARVELS